MIIEAFGALLKALEAIRTGEQDNEAKREKRRLAISSVRSAALATMAYVHDVGESVPIDRARELALSQQWNSAAEAIQAFDQDLFQIAQMKSLGWADPSEWTKLSVDPDKLNLDLIVRQCDWHNSQ